MPEAARSAEAAYETELEAAADATLEAHEGDARAALKTLIGVNAALEDHLARLSGAVSTGFTRGRASRG